MLKKNLWSLTIIIIASVPCLLARPGHIPTAAKELPSSNGGGWSLYSAASRTYKKWYPDGKIRIASYEFLNNSRKSDNFYSVAGDYISYQFIFDDYYYDRFAGHYVKSHVAFGRGYYFAANDLRLGEFCLSPIPLDVATRVDEGKLKIEPWHADAAYQDQKCGKEVIYNPDGSVRKEIQHPYACKYGCDSFSIEEFRAMEKNGTYGLKPGKAMLYTAPPGNPNSVKHYEAPKGKPVHLIRQEGAFALVECYGRKGWVYKKNLLKK